MKAQNKVEKAKPVTKATVMKSAAWGFKILRSLVGWIVEVVRASSRSRQKVWSPVVLQQVKEQKVGIPV